jgi:hypothetical protein
MSAVCNGSSSQERTTVSRRGLRGAWVDGEERLALLQEFGVPAALLMRVDVFLGFFGVYGVPIFGPFVHGANRSALWHPRTRPGEPDFSGRRAPRAAVVDGGTRMVSRFRSGSAGESPDRIQTGDQLVQRLREVI